MRALFALVLFILSKSTSAGIFNSQPDGQRSYNGALFSVSMQTIQRESPGLGFPVVRDGDSTDRLKFPPILEILSPANSSITTSRSTTLWIQELCWGHEDEVRSALARNPAPGDILPFEQLQNSVRQKNLNLNEMNFAELKSIFFYSALIASPRDSSERSYVFRESRRILYENFVRLQEYGRNNGIDETLTELHNFWASYDRCQMRESSSCTLLSGADAQTLLTSSFSNLGRVLSREDRDAFKEEQAYCLCICPQGYRAAEDNRGYACIRSSQALSDTFSYCPRVSISATPPTDPSYAALETSARELGRLLLIDHGSTVP